MSDPLSWSSMLRVVAGLALVLAVFFVLLRLLRRMQPGLAGARTDLRLVAALALSPRERLLLVQVGEQQLLLGSSAQGLRRLHVLPAPLPERGQGGASLGFAERLRRASQRVGPRDCSPGGPA